MARKKATPDSKPRGMAAWKERKEAEIAEKDARIAALESAVAKYADRVPTPTTTKLDIPITFADEAKRKEKPNESRDSWKDELDWIDESVHSVWLVSKKMSITLRPSNTRVLPIVESVMVHATSSGPWLANPFDLRSNEANVDARATKEKLNAVMYANWGFFCITRQLAEDVYGDERHKIPTKAIVDSREFKGYDPTTRRSVGTYRDLVDPDPLRECIRSVLQRIHSTFIDAGHHGDKIMAGFDPRIPNPYRRSLGNLSQKLPAVRQEGATP